MNDAAARGKAIAESGKYGKQRPADQEIQPSRDDSPGNWPPPPDDGWQPPDEPRGKYPPAPEDPPLPVDEPATVDGAALLDDLVTWWGRFIAVTEPRRPAPVGAVGGTHPSRQRAVHAPRGC